MKVNNAIREIIIDKYGNNKLKEVFKSKLFWLGLILKLFLALTLASNFLTELFIPFIDYFVDSGLSNPYKHFLNSNKTNAFPYPALMLYIVSIPRILFGFITDWSVISSASIFLTRLPVFVADFMILIILSRLIKERNKKILLYYWLSPILIYINYIHGQLDVIPISILFIALYFLFKRKFNYSSLFIGLAIAAKTNMVIVVPFYLIYVLYSKTLRLKQIPINFLIIMVSFLLANLPYLFSPEFIQMVFNNKEQIKVLGLNYSFSEGNVLYFAPTAYLFLFIFAISLKGFSKDVFMMFLGFSFGIMALLVTPMQGWYYWIIPFFIYFHAKRPHSRFDFTLLLFISLQIAYFVYFLVSKNSDYFEVFQVALPDLANKPNLYQTLQNIGIDANKVSSLSFTSLQTLLLANCLFIYQAGIKSYSNYKIFSHPFLIGICGDSGAGKTTISNSLISIFKNHNTTIIQGDGMHKWERGNENWDSLTHLNPKSNHLYDEISYLKSIKNSETIHRRNYDHHTGTFTEEKAFKPGNLVIFEGLHSFYIKPMRDLFDLKIFVNPAEELRKNWKIDRDTKKRGYTINKILDQISNRQKDSDKFIKAQIKYADIIIELFNKKNSDGTKDPTIALRITADNSFYLEPLYNKISKLKLMKAKHEYEDNDRQSLEIEGSVTIQELDEVAYSLSLNLELEDIGINDPLWSQDYIGIIQLFITYCVVNRFEQDKDK